MKTIPPKVCGISTPVIRAAGREDHWLGVRKNDHCDIAPDKHPHNLEPRSMTWDREYVRVIVTLCLVSSCHALLAGYQPGYLSPIPTTRKQLFEAILYSLGQDPPCLANAGRHKVYDPPIPQAKLYWRYPVKSTACDTSSKYPLPTDGDHCSAGYSFAAASNFATLLRRGVSSSVGPSTALGALALPIDMLAAAFGRKREMVSWISYQASPGRMSLHLFDRRSRDSPKR